MREQVPSRADIALIAALPEGCTVTARQLERWRQEGLIPETVVQRLGAEGTISSYPDGTVAQVIELVEIRKGDRRLDHALLRLFVRRFPVKEDSLRSLYSGFFGTVTSQAGLGEGQPQWHDEESDELAAAERLVGKLGPHWKSRNGLARTLRFRLRKLATRTLPVDSLVRSAVTQLVTAFLGGGLPNDYEGTAVAEIRAATGASKGETDVILGEGPLLPHLSDEDVAQMCSAVTLDRVEIVVGEASLADLEIARDQWVHVVRLLADLATVAARGRRKRDIGGLEVVLKMARDEVMLGLFVPFWIVLKSALKRMGTELDPLWDPTTPTGREFAEFYALLARLVRHTRQPLTNDNLSATIEGAPEDIRQAFHEWANRSDQRLVLV